MKSRTLTRITAMALFAAWLGAAWSATAGASDTIAFLGLGGLFVAHITGNLVVLAAHS
jgi:uncharacterized membrane protein YoaK (UPF0700 family)